jgi:hypothetical protein
MVWGVQSSGDADSRAAGRLVPPTRQEQQQLKQRLEAAAFEHVLLGCWLQVPGAGWVLAPCSGVSRM